MILSRPEKYRFYNYSNNLWYKIPDDEGFLDSTFIEIQSVFGKPLYRIEREGNSIKLNGYTFNGNIDYLKITRREDIGMGTLTVQLFCEECGDTIYNLSLKLPLLFKIKTDFYVTKD